MRCLDRPFFGCSRLCRSKMLQVSRDDARAIESIIKSISSEQRDGRLAGVDEMIVKNVAQVLMSFGIGEDRQDMRADFQHLRRWRKMVEQMQSYALKAAITLAVTGSVWSVLLGVKALLGRSPS